MAEQSPPFGLSLSPPCLFTKVVEGALTPLREVGVRYLNYPRRLAYPSPIQRAVERSQGLDAFGTSAVGASSQLGKEQALPCAENLFARCGVRLTEERAPAVLNCLSSFRAGMWYTETIVRGSWGIWHPQLQSRGSDCFI